MTFKVTIYHVERLYGGPEEGGWYYEAGTPEPLDEYPTASYASEHDADAHARVVNEALDAGINANSPSLGSVLSTGRYRAIVTDGPAESYPAERPYYS